MRLLLIYQYYLDENDGGRTRFNQFVRYWTDMGHDVTVITGMLTFNSGKKYEKYKGRYIVKEAVSEKITVIRTHVSEKYNNNFLGRLLAYFSFTISSTLASVLFTGKTDVVLVSSPPLFIGLTGCIASFCKRAPLIFEVRDLWPDSAIDLGILKNKALISLSYWLEKIFYRKAVLINALSPGIKDVLVSKKKVSEEKVSLFTNGADLDILKPGPLDNWIRKKYGLEGRFLVLYTGSHGISNNLEIVLSAASLVKDNKDIAFAFVGDGMNRNALIQKAELNGLDNALFFEMQPKKIIADYINASDVCLAVLQKVDTFKTVYPTKIFDYMACKKPVLLGVDGVARQLVEKYECGLYFEPDNAKDLAEKILYLYNNQHMRETMGENGHAYVISNFSAEHIAREYEKQILDSIQLF